ncbi:hypothetical protein J6590_036773 [Homalodisca vitripennis]|nr:hypothetical protein J6590_036773 [Homalodisca vitripennis]
MQVFSAKFADMFSVILTEHKRIECQSFHVRATSLLNHLHDHTVGSGCLFPQKGFAETTHHPRPSPTTNSRTREKRSSRRSLLRTIARKIETERRKSVRQKLVLRLPFRRRRLRDRPRPNGRISVRTREVRADRGPRSGLPQSRRRVPGSLPTNVVAKTRLQGPALRHRPLRKEPAHNTRPQHPPKATDTVTNELFETMRNRRPDPAPKAASLVSDMSSVFTTTHRRPRPPLDLERCLLDTLRGKELCTKTIVAMKTLVHTVKNRELVEATRSIMYVSPDTAVQKPPPPDLRPPQLPVLWQSAILRLRLQDAVLQHLLERSLTHALKPGCKRDPQKMSLDLVFRKALKEIAEELHEIDPEPLVVSLENPMFISGRYLELRLLKKLGEFYRVQCNGLDLSKYLTQSSADKTSPLKQYVDGSRCEEYVRVLHDRYALKSGADLINTKAESLIMPSSMRVWTDVETQASTSLRMYNNVQTLFKKANAADDIVSSITRFTNTYAKHMGHFMKVHQQFLAQALRASELFTWMCFGITTDEALTGNTIMATYYAMANSNSENQCICWNYPLASIIREQR